MYVCKHASAPMHASATLYVCAPVTEVFKNYENVHMRTAVCTLVCIPVPGTSKRSSHFMLKVIPSQKIVISHSGVIIILNVIGT